MTYIAHRGLYNNAIGENTITAFDTAFQHHFSGIELDIRKTKDEKIVVIHDSFISRVSDGFGLVKHFTYDELLKFNFGKVRREKIPLLAEVLKRYQNKIMIIELKEQIKIKELQLNKANQYYLSSFNYHFIKDLPKSPDYKKGIINYVLNTEIDLKKIDFIMILDDLISDNIYNFYNNLGIEVIIYGVGQKVNLNLDQKIRDKIKYIVDCSHFNSEICHKIK